MSEDKEEALENALQQLAALKKDSSEPVLILSHMESELSSLFDKNQLERRMENSFVVMHSCTANVFREISEWDESSLEINWKAEKREFTVSFKGEGQINLSVEELLSKKVPFYIAKSSTCECGENLELGDYRIRTTDNDFTFEGSFVCPKCKSRVFTEGTGLRQIIGQWIKGLKKIEIKPDGFGLERE